MESANVVINEEQSTEDHSEVFQGTQSCHTNSEDTLPKEYVSMPDDQELQILNDAVSKPTTPIRERIQEQGEGSTPSRQTRTRHPW